MARRKDHTPEELRGLILRSAEKIIHSKGLGGLTARSLARAIGYTPGTIYNFYRDMDALILDINYETLGHMHDFCAEGIKGLPSDVSKVRALAHAYVDFAHKNTRAWDTLFAKSKDKTRLPAHYRERLAELFSLIETTIGECLKIPAADIPKTARLLWACMHGITVLTLDGRLNLAGIEKPRDMIDDLLKNYL